MRWPDAVSWVVPIPLIVRGPRTLRQNARGGPPCPYGLAPRNGLRGRRHERLQRTLELRSARFVYCDQFDTFKFEIPGADSLSS
jgi:hypothetical protein